MAANSLKPSAVVKVLLAAIKMMHPIFLWGAPGVGKSALVNQLTGNPLVKQLLAARAGITEGLEEMKVGFIDLRAALLDPVDLRGIPSLLGGLTVWHTPDFLPTSGFGILFIDELPQGTDSVQSALLQLILDRKLGNYVLPPGWIILSAGNRVGDGTFSRKLSKALGSRFATHIEVEVDLDDWCVWAASNNVAPEVISFVRLRPDLLHDFDAKAAGNSFPCPRVWATVSDYVGELDPEIELAFFAGALGEGPAVEFISFLRIFRDLPNIDQILIDPDGTEIPTSPSVQYALCGAMSRRTTVDNADRVFKYMGRMPVEFQVVWMKDTVRVNQEICTSPDFTKWAIEYGDLMA